MAKQKTVNSNSKRTRGRPRKTTKPDALLKHIATKVDAGIKEKSNALNKFVLPKLISQIDTILKFIGVPISNEARADFLRLLGENYNTEAQDFIPFLENKLIPRFRDEIEQHTITQMLESLGKESKDESDSTQT